jgi:transcriptional regulator with XRE-family HTH domain
MCSGLRATRPPPASRPASRQRRASVAPARPVRLARVDHGAWQFLGGGLLLHGAGGDVEYHVSRMGCDQDGERALDHGHRGRVHTYLGLSHFRRGPDPGAAVAMTAHDAERLGVLLRRLRISRGLTQEQLADRSGLSVRAISAMERGRTAKPYQRSVQLLAEALALPDPEHAILMEALVSARGSDMAPTAPAAGTDVHDVTAGARPTQLPADIFEFTGRSVQLAWLFDILAGRGGEGPVRIAAITGAGGIGKTALAVHAAHRLKDDFPDGQLFLKLRGSLGHPLSCGDALARLLRHLGMADAALPDDEAELAAEYRSRMAARRMLVVLDDAYDANQVRPLLPGTASSSVLVTSRSWLPGLEGCRLLKLDALAEDEARALFASICGANRAAAEPVATGRVLAACAGLPLAVRIAASRLVARPGWHISSFARRLADESRRLEEFQIGDLAVRTAFQVSYQALPSGPSLADDTARAFRLLGLWPGPDISLQAAAGLLGLGLMPTDRALEQLVDVHLLEATGDGRYRFHDLIRMFAAERAEQDEFPESREQAIRRVLTWYLHTANAAQSRLSRGQAEHLLRMVPAETGTVPLAFIDSESAVDWSDRERANLAAAVHLANRLGMYRICAELASVTWPNFLRQPWDGWIDVLQVGVDSATQSGDDGARAWLLTYLGQGLIIQGARQDAVSCLQAALMLSRQAGDALCEATAILNLGTALRELKQDDQAISYLEKTLPMHRALGSKHVGSVLMNLGMILVDTGRPQEGMSRMEEALEILNQAGNHTLESLAHSELAAAYQQLGQARGQAVGPRRTRHQP